MMAEGIVVVQTRPQKLRERAPEVLRELRATYAHAGLRPRPPVRAIPGP